MSRPTWLRVAPELIAQALHMPDGTCVVGAGWDGDALVLLVDGDHIPTWLKTPTYALPTVTHHRERFEWTWEKDDGSTEAGS